MPEKVIKGNSKLEFVLAGVKEAFWIIISFDMEFLEIALVSLKVSFASIALASLSGVPFGILLARKQFPGRNFITSLVNASMSVPTVVVGLLVYSLLSRSGPLGDLGLLYTLTAMIIGQALLAFPIVSGLTLAAMNSLDKRIPVTIASLGATAYQSALMYLREARYGIAAAVTAGFSRVFAEIGVSMMLGGNIKGYTRNITTAIALETGKGEFAIGIALGLVLLITAVVINLLFNRFQSKPA
jgi:tungstate transport system permease protein